MREETRAETIHKSPLQSTRTPVALSTMWAQQARFTGKGFLDFLRIAKDAGYAAIEPSHSSPPEHFELLARHPFLPVCSVHAPAPREQYKGRWNGEYSLTADDPEERRGALRFHQRTIEIASDLGARYVVVHLGEVGRGLMPPERRLRELYIAGVREGAEVERRRKEQHRMRAERAPAYLERARQALAQLADYAAARGVTLGLETRLNFFEIPHPQEAVDLMAPYPNELVGYWHDIGHAEVQHRLGLIDRTAWFALLGERLIGMHLHDVIDILDHRAPGNGTLDWDTLAPRFPAAAARTLEIDQREPEIALGPALGLLRSQGIL